MTRTPFTLLLIASNLIVGCGLSEPARNAGPAETDAELSATLTSDMDNNGINDVDQSFVVGNDSNGNVVVLVDPGQKSPEGTAANQLVEFRGMGSGMYSSTEYGWANGWFPAVSGTDPNTGELIGYGNSGFRPGDYEVTLAQVGAEIGELDAWWDLSLGLLDTDTKEAREYLVPHMDGTEDCPRNSVHLAFTVWGDGMVTPLGYSMAPSDPTCY